MAFALACADARNAAFLAERAASALADDHYSAAACDLIAAGAAIERAARELRAALEAMAVRPVASVAGGRHSITLAGTLAEPDSAAADAANAAADERAAACICHRAPANFCSVHRNG